ncbi:MAG: PEP-CTERM sorting domain-containing protein [Betaproteobacteria bacterium]
MIRTLLRTTFALCLAAPFVAQAAEITAGTAEYVTFRDCIPGDTTACDSLSPIVSGLFGGSAGAYSSSATEHYAGYGSASGSVSLSGTIGAPILHASASGDVGKRANTNSVAVQSYTYTGTTTVTRTFGGTLTYSQLVTGNYPNNAGVYATIDAFSLSTPTIDVGDTADSNFYTLFNGGYPGYTDIASSTFLDTASTTSGAGSFGVTVTLTPGETIWLQVLLQTPAANGSWVDASHTLVTGWDDISDLHPAAISVPEPSSLQLLALGLAAVALARRLRRG